MPITKRTAGGGGGGSGDGFSIIQAESGTSPTSGPGATVLTILSDDGNITNRGDSVTNSLYLNLNPTITVSQVNTSGLDLGSGDITNGNHIGCANMDIFNTGFLKLAQSTYLQFTSAASKFIKILPHAAVSANYTILLPQAQGSGFLSNDGSGNTSWAAASVAWGAITGTLSSQTDLNTALGLKAPLASPTFTGTVTMPLTAGTVVSSAGGVLSVVTNANSQPARNYLINGAFDFWQRFGASPTATVANGVSTYIVDRWYIKNSLGTNGIITGAQVAGVTNGSKWGYSVKITTAPTAAQTNGTELYQTLENLDSLNLYGQTASFGVLVKALGLVTQVGIQFFYKTTEAKVDTAIGSETLTTVNTSTFVQCSALAQAIGTTQTSAGVVGVRIRITGVSSGQLYALNNGFIVEQAQINLGSTLGVWGRAGDSASDELRMCQRFYQKSYDIGTAPGTTTIFAGIQYFNGGVTTSASHANTSQWKVSMRIAPTGVTYDHSGTSGKYSQSDASGNPNAGFTAAGFVCGENSGYLALNAVSTPGAMYHYTLDAEI